jgi:hypothetical protein
MLTSLFLAFMFGKGKTTSVMEGVETQAPITQEQSTAPAEGQDNQ